MLSPRRYASVLALAGPLNCALPHWPPRCRALYICTYKCFVECKSSVEHSLESLVWAPPVRLPCDVPNERRSGSGHEEFPRCPSGHPRHTYIALSHSISAPRIGRVGRLAQRRRCASSRSYSCGWGKHTRTCILDSPAPSFLALLHSGNDPPPLIVTPHKNPKRTNKNRMSALDHDWKDPDTFG